MGENMSYLHARSGKQKTASTSSTDAEIIALCEALKICVWLRDTLNELHITPLEEIVMFQDNKSVVMMGTEYTTTKRSKHLLTKLTYIKSLEQSGAVRITWMSTDLMTADVLSKPLHGRVFNVHITSMMGLLTSQHFRQGMMPERKQRKLSGEKRQRQEPLGRGKPAATAPPAIVKPQD
jgi:hypothetical protein